MSSDQLKNAGIPNKSSGTLFKAILWLLFATLACVILFLSFLPTIASTSWGKSKIEAAINSQIPGNVQIGQLSLGWFGQQNIYNVALKSPEGKKILTLARASTSASIFSLWNRTRPNSLEIEDLNAVMEIDASGTTNFERALSQNCCSNSPASAGPVNIELKNAQVKLDLSAANERLAANFTGKTVRNSLQGQFAINAELNGMDSGKLLKGDSVINNLFRPKPGSTFKLNADITNFPVALLDQLLAFERPESAGMLSLLLGEELNGTVHQTATAHGVSFDLSASSPRLTANFQLDANERLVLGKPAAFELQFTPELVDKLVAVMHPENSWKLSHPTTLLLNIDRFSSPLEKAFSEVNLQDVELTANLQVRDAEISGGKPVGSLELHNFQALIEMALGSKSAHLSVTGDALHDKLPLRINVDATVDKPAYLKDLAEQLHKNLTANILVEGNLSQAVDSFFTTNRMVTSTVGKTTSLSALVNMVNNKPVLTATLNASSLQFEDLVITFDGNKVEGEKALFHFNIPARDPSHSPLAGSLAVRGFSWNAAALPEKLQADIIIDELVLNDASRQIKHAIDGTFFADLQLVGSGNMPKGTVSVDMHNDLLSGKASFAIDNAITLKSGSDDGSFLLQLTPDNFPLLRNLMNIGSGQADITLQEPATVRLDLKQLHVPLKGGAPVLHRAAVNSFLTIPRLRLASSTARQSVILADIQANIESDDIANHLAFSTQATGGRGYVDDNGKQAGISVNGTIAQVLTPEGYLHPDMSLALKGSADGIPLPLLCELFCKDPKTNKKIQALLGNRVNIQTKMQLQKMNGPVYLAVNGTNGNFILDGYISNGHLGLNRNFEAEVTVTPELGQHVLGDLAPMLSEVTGADNPIKLTVGQEGFDLPVNAASIEQISIGQAALDIGKVYFVNSGSAARSLKLLAPNNSSFLSVWLTPAYFSLSQGILGLQRVDMLISDRYPVAAWGNVDFARDRVNMMIGLSGAAINKAFNVSGVQNKYMLQLPLRGTVRDASIDKSRVAARVSAIVAQSHGSPQGLVLGTILDVASGGLTEASPPAPTTNPLPWNTLYDEAEVTGTNEPQEEQPSSPKLKNPIKQIGKEATNLLKEIFR